MDAKDLLAEARELISNPDHWTKGAYARVSPTDETGLNFLSPKATCYCMFGALYRVAAVNDIDDKRLDRAELALLRVGGGIGFNDRSSTTHEKVLKKFDEAIACLS